MNRTTRAPRLLRIPDGFLPVAGIAVSLFGQGRLSLKLFAACFATGLFSLFSCRGVRIAFARQPSMRNVRGSVKCALLTQALGFLAVLAVRRALFGREDALSTPLIAAGLLLNIEHTFYEYLYAAGDSQSAAMCRLLTAAFMAAGMRLSLGPGGSIEPLWIPGAAGLSAAVALIVGGVLGGGLRGRINAQPIKDAPRAILHSALYPLAAAAAARLFGRAGWTALAPSFFAGLTLFELCRTPFRRSLSESRPMGLALAAIAAAAAICAGLCLRFASPALIKPVCAACAALILAALCAFALFGRFAAGRE